MNDSQLLPNPEQFQSVKVRALQYLKEGCPGCDTRMIDILRFFNKQPGVATIYCCESHPRRKGKDIFYIQFALTPAGSQFIQTFASHFFRALLEPSLIVQRSLELCKGGRWSVPETVQITEHIYSSVYGCQLSYVSNTDPTVDDKQLMFKMIMSVEVRTITDYVIVHRTIREVMSMY